MGNEFARFGSGVDWYPSRGSISVPNLGDSRSEGLRRSGSLIGLQGGSPDPPPAGSTRGTGGGRRDSRQGVVPAMPVEGGEPGPVASVSPPVGMLAPRSRTSETNAAAAAASRPKRAKRNESAGTVPTPRVAVAPSVPIDVGSVPPTPTLFAATSASPLRAPGFPRRRVRHLVTLVVLVVVRHQATASRQHPVPLASTRRMGRACTWYCLKGGLNQTLALLWGTPGPAPGGGRWGG